MLKKLLLLTIFSLVFGVVYAQNTFAWGVKGGLLVGLQKWESLQRDPLLKYHGDIFIESVPEENDFEIYEEEIDTSNFFIDSISRNKLVLFAQGGLHLKGSAERNSRFFDINGNSFDPPTREFIFRNISIVLGAKQKFDFGNKSTAFYSLGIRGDYTINTNLNDFQNFA
ncbi:MAG: hypothetical protein AAGJ18_28825, partial [Bacteroidota bacterium]